MQIGIQLFLQKYEILLVWTNSYKEKKLTQMGQSCANISRFQNLISGTRFQNSQISALTLCQSSPVCLSVIALKGVHGNDSGDGNYDVDDNDNEDDFGLHNTGFI